MKHTRTTHNALNQPVGVATAAAAAASTTAARPVWLAPAGVIGFALLTIAAAQVAFPLPGTPVPATLQTLAVVLAGVTLGPRLGAVSMALYLLLGLAGHHVFALNHAGVTTVFGATGGYLIGFLLAQPAVGAICRRGNTRWPTILAAVLAGHAIIFAAGLVWLAFWSGTTPSQTLALGLWPFVPGMILKTAIAVSAGRLIVPHARRLFG